MPPSVVRTADVSIYMKNVGSWSSRSEIVTVRQDIEFLRPPQNETERFRRVRCSFRTAGIKELRKIEIKVISVHELLYSPLAAFVRRLPLHLSQHSYHSHRM